VSKLKSPNLKIVRVGGNQRTVAKRHILLQLDVVRRLRRLTSADSVQKD
jgi:hypothetical protein